LIEKQLAVFGVAAVKYDGATEQISSNYHSSLANFN